MTEIDYIPPQNLEAEMALLGAIMVDRELVPIAQSLVQPKDFYAYVHELIYATQCALFDAGRPIDKITLSEALRSHGMLEKVGGVSYLSSLLDSVQTASSLEYYAKIVVEKAALRKLLDVARKIKQIVYDGGEDDVASAIANVEALVRNATERSFGDMGSPIFDVVRDTYREIDIASQSTRPSGVTTPWPKIDATLGRIHPAELVVVAGAPGSGKSVAVSQIVTRIAVAHGTVAFFPVEMGAKDTVRRMIGNRARISSRRLRLGDVRGGEWDKLADAMSWVAGLPIRIFDRHPEKSVADIRRAVSRMRLDGPVAAIVVDHANFLADANAEGRSSKHERLDRMYQRLLMLGSEFECPVIVVQHLNRSGMGGVPTLKDLRDGGNLEGHAHIVIFVHRPNETEQPEVGEFIIAKNRDYRTGKIDMTFDGAALEWREADALEGVA